MIDYISPYFQGSYDSNIFSFYNYFIELLNIKINSNLIKKYRIWEKTLKYNQIFTLNDICFVSQKPLEINKNENSFLHADGKASIIYAGGLEFYYLNGINVPKWLVLTPKKELNCKELYKIDNVEIRQEFIKKVGLERVLKELNCKIIDKINADDLYKKNKIGSWIQQGDVILEPEYENIIEYKDLKRSFKNNLKNISYELINLDIGDNNYRPYLKMTNASLLNEVHIEGVSIDCESVFDAICWRNQKETLPCLLT